MMFSSRPTFWMGCLGFIGVEYLYQQTDLQDLQVLQDYKLAIEKSETNDVEVDEVAAEPEEFQDITIPTFEPEVTPAASSQARPASCIMPVSALIVASSMPPPSLVPPSLGTVTNSEDTHVCLP